MNVSIAHLGPCGTYAEKAAISYTEWLAQNYSINSHLYPYPSIAQTLMAVSEDEVDLAVVPVENSIEGSVTVTIDTLWQLEKLQIESALVIPITHMLISCASNLEEIKIVYSHPQALAQCQRWLGKYLPNVKLVPTSSTTEALTRLSEDLSAATISSQRAAQLYNLPILKSTINDYPQNCTRFWIISNCQKTNQTNQDFQYNTVVATRSHTSLAFSTSENIPGALAKPLQIFAQLGINLSRIESRPTKRSLGEYLFFIDIEADAANPKTKSALEQLDDYTEVLRIFGSYSILPTFRDS
ncbi:MAG: prephenate dehydratase [Cyanobacteria bacterium P01_A01_bin.68]